MSLEAVVIDDEQIDGEKPGSQFRPARNRFSLSGCSAHAPSVGGRQRQQTESSRTVSVADYS